MMDYILKYMNTQLKKDLWNNTYPNYVIHFDIFYFIYFILLHFEQDCWRDLFIDFTTTKGSVTVPFKFKNHWSHWTLTF